MEFTLGLGVLTGGSGTFRKSLNTMIRRACFWCAQDRRGMGSGFALCCRSLKLWMPTHYWSLAFILFAVRTDFWNTRSVLEIRCLFAWQGVSIFDECLIKEQPRLRQLGVNAETTFRSWLHVEVCTFVHRFHNLLFFAVSYWLNM